MVKLKAGQRKMLPKPRVVVASGPGEDRGRSSKGLAILFLKLRGGSVDACFMVAI